MSSDSLNRFRAFVEKAGRGFPSCPLPGRGTSWMSDLQKYRLVKAPQGSPAWNQAYEEVMFQQGEGLPF